MRTRAGVAPGSSFRERSSPEDNPHAFAMQFRLFDAAIQSRPDRFGVPEPAQRRIRSEASPVRKTETTPPPTAKAPMRKATRSLPETREHAGYRRDEAPATAQADAARTAARNRADPVHRTPPEATAASGRARAQPAAQSADSASRTSRGHRATRELRAAERGAETAEVGLPPRDSVC